MRHKNCLNGRSIYHGYRESGLNIQIIFDESKCFDSMMAHYGKFSGVENYIALVRKKFITIRENGDGTSVSFEI